MSVKKNIILVCLMLVLCFFVIGKVNAESYENYYGIEMTNSEYSTLLNLGFSEDEIYYMDENTFNENKNLDALLMGKEEKYYKTIYTNLNGDTTSIEVTEEEYENQGLINPRNEVETTYKKMVTTLSKNGSKFRYKISLTWKRMPAVRSYDIIGIGFEDPVYIDSSVYLNYYWCNSSGSCVTDSSYYDKQKTSTGGSAVYKIPSSAASLASTLYYDVSKNTSSTITSLRMYGDYAHATSTISGSTAANHHISRVGIELTASNISYYDAIPCAQSVWSGTW